jgi:hypothetical protein
MNYFIFAIIYILYAIKSAMKNKELETLFLIVHSVTFISLLCFVEIWKNLVMKKNLICYNLSRSNSRDAEIMYYTLYLISNY